MNSLCTAIPVDIKLIQNPVRHFWAGSRESRIQIWENQQVSISSYFYYRVQSWDFEIKKKGERRELGGMRWLGQDYQCGNRSNALSQQDTRMPGNCQHARRHQGCAEEARASHTGWTCGKSKHFPYASQEILWKKYFPVKYVFSK